MSKSKFFLFYSLACVASIIANPTTKLQKKAAAAEEDYESKLLSMMDDLNRRDSIGIVGNVISLERLSAAEERNESHKSSVKDRRAVDPLTRRIDEFFRCRRLRIAVPYTAADFYSALDRSSRDFGGKNFEFELKNLVDGDTEPRTKIKRLILPLLLALKLKAVIVLPILLTIVGLIGINGLGAAVLALMLSGAVALKALLTPSTPPSSSYSSNNNVAPIFPARLAFAKPPMDYYDQHWHRSQDEGVPKQPYRAWTPLEPAMEAQFVGASHNAALPVQAAKR